MAGGAPTCLNSDELEQQGNDPLHPVYSQIHDAKAKFDVTTASAMVVGNDRTHLFVAMLWHGDSGMAESDQML
jgi:hypothetical protein